MPTAFEIPAGLEAHGYRYTNFTELNDSKLLEILSWRNDPRVRQWQFTNAVIEAAEHLQYCRGLKHRYDCAYWLLAKGTTDIGVISFTKFDQGRNAIEWGFYLNPKWFRSGFSLEIFLMAQYLFFVVLKVDRLTGYVRCDNSNAMLLNDFFGMKQLSIEEIRGVAYSYREQEKENWNSFNFDLSILRKEFVKFMQSRKQASS